MDKKEFHKCFNENYERLCRWAYIILKSKAEAEDVVQKVFVRIWENRTKIEIEKDLRVYLYQMVKNESINHRKAKVTRYFYEERYMEGNREKSGVQFNEEYFTRCLKKAINHLPEKMRLVYSLKYLEGLTYNEIADYMEISIHTVDSHIQKALTALRRELVQYQELFFNN